MLPFAAIAKPSSGPKPTWWCLCCCCRHVAATCSRISGYFFLHSHAPLRSVRVGVLCFLHPFPHILATRRLHTKCCLLSAKITLRMFCRMPIDCYERQLSVCCAAVAAAAAAYVTSVLDFGLPPPAANNSSSSSSGNSSNHAHLQIESDNSITCAGMQNKSKVMPHATAAAAPAAARACPTSLLLPHSLPFPQAAHKISISTIKATKRTTVHNKFLYKTLNWNCWLKSELSQNE